MLGQNLATQTEQALSPPQTWEPATSTLFCLLFCVAKAQAATAPPATADPTTNHHHAGPLPAGWSCCLPTPFAPAGGEMPALVLVAVPVTLLVLVAVLVAVLVIVLVRVVVGSKGTNFSGWKVTAPMNMGLMLASETPPVNANVELTSELRKVVE